MEYNLGDKIIYQEEEYYVYWIYDSQYIEISKDNRNNCELVHISEIQKRNG
ncbi:hypothetical protein [Bacillus sp. BHET2]|uniref:hypothetical protein n=1 Tax=Bacillus sp. BHET2 TaxID=2583818 RepID=UPI001486C077|nr:hypothetical protein [Bacillus sp. BHET2]